MIEHGKVPRNQFLSYQLPGGLFGKPAISAVTSVIIIIDKK
jgi:hypothetical protein